jgi:hypothetical protein
MVASITRTQSPFHILINQIFDLQLSDVCHTFKGSVSSCMYLIRPQADQNMNMKNGVFWVVTPWKPQILQNMNTSPTVESNELHYPCRRRQKTNMARVTLSVASSINAVCLSWSPFNPLLSWSVTSTTNPTVRLLHNKILMSLPSLPFFFFSHSLSRREHIRFRMDLPRDVAKTATNEKGIKT